MGATYHYVTMRRARLLVVGAACWLVVEMMALPLVFAIGGFTSVLVLIGMVLVSMGVVMAALGEVDELGIRFELRTRGRFNAVCREKGLTTKNERGDPVYPVLSRLAGSWDVMTAHVRPLAGQSVADWDRAAAAFTLAYGVAGVRFRDNGDGSLTMVVGYQRLEAREIVVPPDSAVVPVGGSWREYLTSVVVGTTEHGATYAVPFLGSHILIAGKTGAGKGSVIWSLVLGLTGACRAGVVRFWALDPKRLELRIGRGFFGDRYATTEEQSVALLERAVAEMFARGDELAGHARKSEPSEQYPVEVIILDELGFTSSMLTDRKLQQRAEKALKTLLMLGRAVGFVVVGALQDPRKETLSERDLFPTRVAMRLDKPMVDLVLGNGAHDAGALCEQIPMPEQGGAGVAFVTSPATGSPVCVRFTWCSDEMIRNTARLISGGDEPPMLGAVG